ncbi:unnamed protein product [Blepharisma stoltei]|uniref:Uncharacterized protein n=1 Tax=Blepharisma stoltei TaxID=1481888 RepID=A0AAU9KJ42_9CILI|nr:unnamed protein product [Blepharisma stoltei]
MINSVSYPFELIKDALSGLVECEKNRIHDSSLYINLLLWAGIIILGLCLCVLLYFIVRLKSAYENFWKFIKNSVVSSYSSLRQVALDRLTSIHGLEINKENDLIQKNPKKKSNYVKANIIWKFCWRLSFFAIISIAFILAILYLYKACETYMINRPKLLQNFNIRRALLARIGYFTRDINKPPYLDIYKKSYSLADPSIEFENTILWYWEEYKNLHSKDLQDLLSSSLKDRLFEEIDSQFDILKYGTGVAANSAIFDSFYMSVHEYRSYTVKYSYLTNFGILQDSMADDFDMADSSSKQVISLQLSIIIGITILFSFELALLYLLYYIPFIRAQTKHLEEASILPKMIPEIEIGKKFDGSTKSNLLNFNSF